MKDYEINSSTLAILPIDSNTSKVFEEDDEYIVEKSSNSIIKENCEFYGSSYEGRCAGTKYLTGIKCKYPIIIEESRNLIFFPTNSIRNDESSWIALNKIKEYHKKRVFNEEMNQYNNISKIIFKNDEIIDINISFYSLENQICRAALLKSKLYEIKNKEKN